MIVDVGCHSYIPHFSIVVVAYEYMIVLSVYICLILMRE